MSVATIQPQSVSKTRTIPMYKVLILNDDKTTMEFVVAILKTIFNKSTEDAKKITVEIHETGCGLAGVYTKELAELKQEQTISQARAYKFPLQLTIEPA